MKTPIPINKTRGLYGKTLIRLQEVNEAFNRRDICLPYSHIYEKLGRGFSIKKPDIRELLFLLRDIGLIEISNKGIKLNYKIQNEK